MDNCLQEAPHGSQDGYPHYNLFQSSVFYDMDNFRGALSYDECFSSKTTQRNTEPPDKSQSHEEAAETIGNDKRVISKEDLFKDPELFQSRMEDVQAMHRSEPCYHCASQPWGYDWTKQSWVKSGASPVVLSKKELRKHKRKMQPNLCKQLQNAPRISISKAESMMQKMGWQGGALGKAAEGILDPITPNPLYGSSNLGFGQQVKNPPSAPPKKGSRKDILRTNALFHILDFVRDDTEIELLFDAGLRHCERRVIHMLVHDILNASNVMSLSSTAQYELAVDINRHNQYELGTVSEGEPPNRQMTIFKEAPEHVYLVTPDDFLPKVETDEQTEQGSPATLDKENHSSGKNDLSCKDVAKAKNAIDTKVIEMEDDENPFLKSIKKSIKKDEEPITNKFEKDCNIAKDETTDITNDASPRHKIVQFFLEFVESDAFKEFRFLGKFTAEQTTVINEFLNDIAMCIDDVTHFKGNQAVLNVFKTGNSKYELKEGCNGTIEIHKKPIRRI